MKYENFKKIRDYNYGDLVVETEYWFILLAPDQKNLGTCVVALKRCDGDLARLKNEEWQGFSEVVRKLQAALKNAFNPVMFNWGCLMNSSYLNDPPDPHVHWHVIPRYKDIVQFEDITFKDPCFGFSTMKSKEGLREVPQDVRIKIIKEIRDNFKI